MDLRPKPPQITKAQRNLWAEINDTIRECGAWTISQPDVFPIRFECPVDSQAPLCLDQEKFGSIRHIGTHERLMPTTTIEYRGTHKVTTQQMAPGVAAVYELSLIGNKAKAPD
jgi:hypothetical protein